MSRLDTSPLGANYSLSDARDVTFGGTFGAEQEGWARETYRDGQLIEGDRWRASAPGQPALIDPDTGVETFAVRTSQIDVRNLPPGSGPIEMRPFDLVDALRQQDLQHYRAAQDRADSVGDYVAAKVGGLAVEVAYDAADAARALYNLATDANARAQAIDGLGYLAAHPMAPVVGAINGTAEFLSRPFNEQADSLFKGGLSMLAGGGVGRVGATAGRYALDGIENTARLLGPTTDQILFSSMDRMGFVLRAAPEGPSLYPRGLLGDARRLAANMEGVPEGYQAHHLGMSSILRESPAFRSLAEKGLYDINRPTNGLALPSNPFLSLADQQPLHRGFHGKEYRLAVENAVSDIDYAYARGASDATLLRRIDRMEQSLSSRLLSGDLWLNDADAALRKLGPFR